MASRANAVAVGPTGLGLTVVDGKIATFDVAGAACRSFGSVGFVGFVSKRTDATSHHTTFEPLSADTVSSACKVAAAASGDDAALVVGLTSGGFQTRKGSNKGERALVVACTPSASAVTWSCALPSSAGTTTCCVVSAAMLDAATGVVITASGDAFAVSAAGGAVALNCGAPVRAVAALDSELIALLMADKLVVASLADEEGELEIVAEYPFARPVAGLPATSASSWVALAVAPQAEQGAPAFAVRHVDTSSAAKGVGLVYSGAAGGQPLGRFDGVSALAAIDATTLAIATPEQLHVVSTIVTSAALVDEDGASPSGRKSAGGKKSKKASEEAAAPGVKVQTATIPIAPGTFSAVHGPADLSVTAEGDALQITGPYGFTGVATVVVPILALRSVVGEEASGAALTALDDALYGNTALLRGGAAGAGALDGTDDSSSSSKMALHYAARVHRAAADAEDTLLVSVTTARSVAHGRRARDRAEVAAVATLAGWATRMCSELVQFDPETMAPVCTVAVEWNHAVLRAALKRLGASKANGAVISSCRAARRSDNFLAALAHCNAVGAAVTLQHQLGFATPLPRPPSKTNPSEPSEVASLLQFYGVLLAEARGLAQPCTTMAARWACLLRDAARRGIVPTGAAAAVEDGQQTASTKHSGGKTSRGGKQQQHRAADAVGMRLVHGGGNASGSATQRRVRGIGGDTLAATVESIVKSLPVSIQTPESLFGKASSFTADSDSAAVAAAAPGAGDDAVPAAERAVAADPQLDALSAYERRTLGLPPRQQGRRDGMPAYDRNAALAAADKAPAL